jgi:hypothetical protein
VLEGQEVHFRGHQGVDVLLGVQAQVCLSSPLQRVPDLSRDIGWVRIGAKSDYILRLMEGEDGLECA